MPIPSVLRYSRAALLAATLAGCTSTTTIDVDDHSVFIPSARMSVSLSKQQEPPSEPQNGHAIEAGYTLAKGTGSQSLSPGQDSIELGGKVFNAPQELRHEFDYRHAEIRYRYRKFVGTNRNFGFEALGGVVNSQLKLSSSSPSQRASDKFSSNGLSGGVGAIWKLRPTTSLEARYSIFVATETRGNRAELFAVQALGANAAIRGGFTWWYVRADQLDLASDVAVRFRGPAVSLDLMF